MGLLCRARDASLPSLPTEVWVKHIFPWCPKWWFETSSVSTPGLAPHRALTPCKQAEDSDNDEDQHSDDDGVSTRAPSSGIRSTNTTPETGPSVPLETPPEDAEMDMAERTPSAAQAADP